MLVLAMGSGGYVFATFQRSVGRWPGSCFWSPISLQVEILSGHWPGIATFDHLFHWKCQILVGNDQEYVQLSPLLCWGTGLNLGLHFGGPGVVDLQHSTFPCKPTFCHFQGPREVDHQNLIYDFWTKKMQVFGSIWTLKNTLFSTFWPIKMHFFHN